MRYNNKKNPLIVNKPKAPAKPAEENATAKANSDSTSLKFASPEIRVGLSSSSKKSPVSKMPKDKKVIDPKVKAPKIKKPKVK